MKEELQSKLVEILGSIQTAAGKAGDFAMAQLPDIAQQYVTYGRALATVFAVVGLGIFLLGFWTVHMVNARARVADARFNAALKEWQEKEAQERARVGYFYESAPSRHHYFEVSDLSPAQYTPFVIGAVLFFVNLSGFLLVWFAPKVWLLKEIASLVK